jgi:hypothetical protein
MEHMRIPQLPQAVSLIECQPPDQFECWQDSATGLSVEPPAPADFALLNEQPLQG